MRDQGREENEPVKGPGQILRTKCAILASRSWKVWERGTQYVRSDWMEGEPQVREN